jgi:hypothetical protein
VSGVWEYHMSDGWEYTMKRYAGGWYWELSIPTTDRIGTCYSDWSITKFGAHRKMKRLKRNHIREHNSKLSGVL